MWESIASLIIGIVASQIISKYYYKRGLKKYLTPYVKFSSSPLDGVDPAVRMAMEISYQGKNLTAFHEIQFLVANTGDKAIRDIIDPLAVNIPDGCALLDATILYVFPEGRSIDAQYDPDSRHVVFNITLLNPRDFFIVKLLLDGKPKRSDFRFRITVDEIDPILEVEHLPYDALDTRDHDPFKNMNRFAGAIITIIGASILYLGFTGFLLLPPLDISSPWKFVIDAGLLGPSVLVGGAIGFIIVLAGVGLATSSWWEIISRHRKLRFKIPDDPSLKVRSISDRYDP